jgi:hypothetical protein
MSEKKSILAKLAQAAWQGFGHKDTRSHTKTHEGLKTETRTLRLKSESLTL